MCNACSVNEMDCKYCAELVMTRKHPKKRANLKTLIKFWKEPWPDPDEVEFLVYQNGGLRSRDLMSPIVRIRESKKALEAYLIEAYKSLQPLPKRAQRFTEEEYIAYRKYPDPIKTTQELNSVKNNDG